MKGKKLIPYPRLRKYARQVFARWIVNRDPVCITCGRPSKHSGHYIHANVYDFHEQINNGQCIYCNLYLHGNLAIYTLKMIDKYGREQVEKFHEMKHEVIKFSREFLENVIEKYKL